ncbi:NACHT, LRR and PYD domains-containing protein 14-like [Rana temporaria]|uniref:NACHT, LRR and PYD domains-containing protein 14-like n=1 Tax=Rana temporaria TaxID=8407 RepID=UPI001AACE3EE|nr:NACHT, LRR and PYD domains-containing protein 14-like [Rana temporaria]
MASSDEQGSPKRMKMCNEGTGEDFRKKYMESEKEKYQSIKNDYCNLIMIRNTQNKEVIEDKRTASGIKHPQIMGERTSEEHSPTTIQALFDPDEDGSTPKIVVLEGPAGIGKTMTCEKIMLDWASGDLYQDKFDFVIYLSCREIGSKYISLAKRLSEACGLEEDVIKSILNNPEKLLFLVDGFDEVEWFKRYSWGICKDPFQSTNTHSLLGGLLSKQCLPEASLIITRKPMVIQTLNELIKESCSSFVEIQGFTGEERKKYVCNQSILNRQPEDKALSIIQDNDLLFSLCAVPSMAQMVCNQIAKYPESSSCKTATYFLLSYLKDLITDPGTGNDNMEHNIKNSLIELCELANKGIQKQQNTIEKKELHLHTPLSKFVSVFVNLFRDITGTQAYYSFIHQNVQEFLAALDFVLNYHPCYRECNSLVEILHRKSFSELCRDEPHLSPVIRFLFGFFNENLVWEFSNDIRIDFQPLAKTYMLEWIMFDDPSGISTEAISCLYETQNDNIIKKIMSQSNFNIGPSRIPKSLNRKKCPKELCYWLNVCKSKNLTFQNVTMDSETLERLSPFIHDCQQLSLNSCDWTPSCWDALRSILIKKGSLTKLVLSCNPILDHEIKTLCEGLGDLHCTLQDVSLYRCVLSASCCSDLSSVLITNRSLTKLDLSWNDLQDSGIKVLCDGLSDPKCTLQELNLSHCDLTTSCCSDFCSVLITNRFLTTLDLSENDLQDSGVKLLCKGLTHPRCTLQNLRLQRCGLTRACCNDLRSVLITNRFLTKLDVSECDLYDSGAKVLCKSLRDTRCNLQDLSLNDCCLTSSCCDDLSIVLFKNPIITKLDLSENDLQDSGVKHLCKGLRAPGCRLQVLGLQLCRLTSLCCEDLQSVLITNQSLQILDLSGNQLQDSGIKLLCDGLKDPKCTLQEMSLQQCDLTSVCCQDLQSVLITNRSLRKLDLSGNQLQDSGIKLLCDGLKDPKCTLKEMRFIHSFGKMLSAESLFSVIRKKSIQLEASLVVSQSEANDCINQLQHLCCTWAWNQTSLLGEIYITYKRCT